MYVYSGRLPRCHGLVALDYLCGAPLSIVYAFRLLLTTDTFHGLVEAVLIAAVVGGCCSVRLRAVFGTHLRNLA